MKIFLAFSTGKMLGRVLSKLLGRKEVDVSNRKEMDEISENHKDELEKAQKLVRKGGEIDKLINSMTDGMDDSYKNQFVNWLWVALADEETFDKLITINHDSIQVDTHVSTEIIDRLNDFSNHAKFHADFRNECGEILRGIKSSDGFMKVGDFGIKMNSLNRRWDKRKKFLVNQETTDKSWANIEANEIHVDGDWGDLHVYEIPCWQDLMQTCNHTSWCVSKKGDSGKRYYDYYKEPYFLICDGRRNPYALLNPPSQQFKTTDDHPISESLSSTVFDAYPPLTRDTVLLGYKLITEKTEFHGGLDDDFEVFKKVKELGREKKKDKEKPEIDYDKALDNVMREQPDLKIDSNLVLDDAMIDNLPHSKYTNLPDDIRNAFLDRVLRGKSTVKCLPGWKIEDLFERNDFSRIVQFIENKSFPIRLTDSIDKKMSCHEYIMILMDLEKSNMLDCECFVSFIRKYFDSATDKDKKLMLNWAMVSKSCPVELVKELQGKFKYSVKINFDNVFVIQKGCETGKLDKSVFRQLEQYILEHVREAITNYWKISKIFQSNLVDNDFRKKLYDTVKGVIQKSEKAQQGDESFSQSDVMKSIDMQSAKNVISSLLYTNQQDIIQEKAQEIERMIDKNPAAFKAQLDNSYSFDFDSEREMCMGAIESKFCPKSTFDKVLKCINYGKGDTSYKNGDDTFCVMSRILHSENLDEQGFKNILAVNPKTVVVFGWWHQFCTKEVKISLIRKFLKENAKIFKKQICDEIDNDVIKEYIRTCVDNSLFSSAYALDMEGLTLDDDFVKEILSKLTVNDDSSDSSDVKDFIHRLFSSNLSEKVINEIYDNRKNMSIDTSTIKNQFQFCKNACNSEEFLMKLIRDKDLFTLDDCIKDDISEPLLKKLIDEMEKTNMLEHDFLAVEILCKENCPIDTFQKYYKKLIDHPITIGVGYKNVLFYGIRNGKLTAKQILEDVSDWLKAKNEYQCTIVDEICDTKALSDEEKEWIVEKLPLENLGTDAMHTLEHQLNSKKLFKRLLGIIEENGDSEEGAYSLMCNENYGKDMLKGLADTSFKTLEHYVFRFGIDENVVNSRYMFQLLEKLLQNGSIKMYPISSLKLLLKSKNKNVVWIVKTLIGRMAHLMDDGTRDANEVKASVVAGRIASGLPMDGIVVRIARDYMENWK